MRQMTRVRRSPALPGMHFPPCPGWRRVWFLPQSQTGGAGLVLQAGPFTAQAGKLAKMRIHPGSPASHHLAVDQPAVSPDQRYHAAIGIPGYGLQHHLTTCQQMPGSLQRCPAIALPKLRTVNAVQAHAQRFATAPHLEGIPICQTDDLCRPHTALPGPFRIAVPLKKANPPGSRPGNKYKEATKRQQKNNFSFLSLHSASPSRKMATTDPWPDSDAQRNRENKNMTQKKLHIGLRVAYSIVLYGIKCM